MPRIDKDEVRAALSVSDYAEGHLGVALRRSGAELRGECPVCGSSSRLPFCVKDDVWHCHHCHEGGDVLSLCELVEEVDFATACNVLGQIAGLDPSGPGLDDIERERRRVQREAEKAERRRQDEERRIAAEQRSRAIWDKLSRVSVAGLDYLRDRGVAGVLGDVRFDGRGSVNLPLRQANGTITNVVRRLSGPPIDDDEPKVKGVPGASSAGVFGDPRKFRDTEGAIVVVEGFFDWLSARVLAPNRLILGAHGSGRLAHAVQIAAEAAGPRLGDRGFVFVPHQDDVGEKQARKALELARDDLGVPSSKLFVFDVAPKKGDDDDDRGISDLNDWLCANLGEAGRDPFARIRSLADAAQHRCFDLTDAGNGARFAYYYRDELRYVPELGQWFQWDGKVWVKAHAKTRIVRASIEVTDHIEREAIMTAKRDSAMAAELHKWARTSRSKERIAAMHSLACAMPEVAAGLDQLDRDSYLLAVENGTLDLRTGQLGPHRREDLITNLSRVLYDPDAHCPRWERFIAEVFEPNPDAAVFVQRYFGYSLTGDTSAQCLLFAHGTGGNGKGVLFRRLKAILGGLAYTAPHDTFIKKRSGEAPIRALAQMRGVRAVLISEFNKGDKLDEGLIKAITGGDPITGEAKYKDPFEFLPRFKLWMSSNHLPNISGVDDGFWRRFRLVPFEVSFKDSRRDDYLEQALEQETPGILAWAVRGCQDWLHDGGGLRGLGESESVSGATGALRADSDFVGRFLEEWCVVTPSARVSRSALYEKYRKWCQESGSNPMNKISFGRAMGERGYLESKVRGTRYWQGIGLQSSRYEE